MRKAYWNLSVRDLNDFMWEKTAGTTWPYVLLEEIAKGAISGRVDTFEFDHSKFFTEIKVPPANARRSLRWLEKKGLIIKVSERIFRSTHLITWRLPFVAEYLREQVEKNSLKAKIEGSG